MNDKKFHDSNNVCSTSSYGHLHGYICPHGYDNTKDDIVMYRYLLVTID